MSDHLFVYGTLRAGLNHPLLRLLARHGSPVGPARFGGRLYDLGAYPGVVPDRGAGWRVAGDLWLLHAPALVLPELDRYEGCHPAQPPPHEYRRERHPVRVADGTTREAWIYLYNGAVDPGRLIRSGDYFNRTPETP